MKRNNIFVILTRLFRLIIWLGGIGIRLHSLDKATLEQRNAILREMGESALAILNVRINLITPPKNTETRGTLVVANHVSWLDIFVLDALFPSSFIAMKELQNWFVIGKMIRNTGAVFIDRSNRKDIDPINQAIAERLQTGGNVCFFPEAKTSLGNGILPLKAALFQSAINANAPIQAVALRYYDSEQQRTEQVSFANANFFVSMWRILSIPEITVNVNCAEPILPKPSPEIDRFVLKDQVSEFLHDVVLSDSPAPERLLPPHRMHELAKGGAK